VLADPGNGVFDDNDSLNNDPYFSGFGADYPDPATYGYPPLGTSHLDIPPVYPGASGRGAQQYGPAYQHTTALDHLDSYGAPQGASNGRGVHLMTSSTPPPMMMGEQFYTSGPSKGQMHHHDLYHASSLGMTQ
jgi:hypothetical protein